MRWAGLGAVVHRCPRGPRTRRHQRTRPGRRPLLGRQGLPGRRRHGLRSYRGRWEMLSTGQQAVATLNSWRILRKLRCSTISISSLVQPSFACIWPAQTENGKSSLPTVSWIQRTPIANFFRHLGFGKVNESGCSDAQGVLGAVSGLQVRVQVDGTAVDAALIEHMA